MLGCRRKRTSKLFAFQLSCLDKILIIALFRVIAQLQLQKLVNNWSLEQRDEVTFAAVCNRAAKNFVMVVNKSVSINVNHTFLVYTIDCLWSV